MQYIESVLLECPAKHAELCLMEDKSEAEERFTQEVLLPLIDEMIASIDRHPEAFKNEEAAKMLTSIFGNLKDDISLKFNVSVRTLRAALHLVKIDVTDTQYSVSLRRALMYLYEYGYRAISDGCQEVCDDTAGQVG